MNREPKVNIKYNDANMASDGKGIQYKLGIGGSYGKVNKHAVKGKRSKSLKSRANRRKAK